jgi:hypothetical protein
MNNKINELSELNDDWIKNFEENEKLYNDFYKDDLYYINLKVVYINKFNEIEKIKQECYLMTNPNIISREEILQLFKTHSIDNNLKYKLKSILRYNITLDVNEIKTFLKNPLNYKNYLSTIKNIDTINFEKTINYFHDLNDVYFIFHEELKEKKNITKKIFSKYSKKNTIKNHVNK